MVIMFTVPGEPKGKGRPRLGRSGHAYTPHDTAVYENLVKVCFKEKYPKHVPLDPDAEVRAEIKVFYSIPKSASKKKRNDMLMGFTRPKKKPDCDNIAKIICDALNGIVYHDDSQVVDLEIRKYYSDEPKVKIRMEWDDGED